jgi:methyl-accepting chemotaxis protein
VKLSLSLAGSLALLAASWLLAEAAFTLRAWRSVPDHVLELANNHLTALSSIADARLAHAEDRVDAQVTALRKDLLGLAGGFVERADARTGETLNLLDARTRAIVAAVEKPSDALTVSIESLDPTINAVNDLSPSLMRNALGTVAAVKVTAGETAQTMKTIRDAAPEIATSIKASANASQQAALSAAQTSQNLATLTKPGPKWLRYAGLGFQIAVPAAQVATPFMLNRR